MAKLNCSKCGEIKTGSYVKESQCSKCSNERRKKLRARRRAEKGLPPIGSGRDPKCKICRELKEDRYMDGSYCAKCKLEKMKIAYADKRAEQGIRPRRKGRSPICKCNRVKENKGAALCNKCDAKKKRDYHKKNSENPEYRLKIAARTTVNRYVKLGLLLKKPCEVCKAKKVEAHHDDYIKPLEVRWLCRKHHADHHKKNK